ncbi:PREDICTED: probable phosphoinositide phosphatase SAC9 [Nelumbo nucifera]|uniref:Probable phosphoinositide phosphatase SAC9 n=1 Tax=Nelumbo nucifera TaxID=4432 RepID=A0A1U8B5H5_NELNU|nr:PREDICTED: probable phosphoinositide phosphatase SAC9 [Nelumbo nucifera]
MDIEISTLLENDTWELVPPPDASAIGSLWIYSVKFKSDGNLDRYKARLVAYGYKQEYKIDYEEIGRHLPIDDQDGIRHLKKLLSQSFKMKSLDSKLVDNPLEINLKLIKDDSLLLEHATLYRQLVQIWVSNKINKEERSCVGKWDIQSLISSSSEFYGPEKSGSENDVPRHVKFTFKNQIRCRIIWITLRIRRPGSSSIHLDQEFDLFSLDENPFEHSRRASFGGTVQSEPCIHAKRFLVAGSHVRNDLGLASQRSDNINLKSWLERAPQLSRFKVPVEAERLFDNDLVLEQYLSPASPPLAGFRLDAFTVIKPRITHSPSSLEVGIWDNSLTCLEDRHIFPAVLFIHVSALQVVRSESLSSTLLLHYLH